MPLHQTWGRMNELASAIVACFSACFWMCLAVQDLAISTFQFKSQFQLPLMTWQHIWFSRPLSEWPQTQHNHCQHAACDQLEQHRAEETTGTATQHTPSSIKPSEAEKESDAAAVRQPSQSSHRGAHIRIVEGLSVVWLLMISPHS